MFEKLITDGICYIETPEGVRTYLKQAPATNLDLKQIAEKIGVFDKEKDECDFKYASILSNIEKHYTYDKNDHKLTFTEHNKLVEYIKIKVVKNFNKIFSDNIIKDKSYDINITSNYINTRDAFREHVDESSSYMCKNIMQKDISKFIDLLKNDGFFEHENDGGDLSDLPDLIINGKRCVVIGKNLYFTYYLPNQDIPECYQLVNTLREFFSIEMN